MISKYKIYRFKISVEPNTVREGFLLSLEDSTGNISWGEISPLKGWSKETLQQALDSLSQEADNLIGTDPSRALENIMLNTQMASSVSFGLFGALVGFQKLEKSLSVPLSGLLYGTYKDILEQIPYMNQMQFSFVKLKTSQLSVVQAIELTNLLLGHFKLRIDVNSLWSKQDVDVFLSHFSPTDFDYIEDPYPKGENIDAFSYPLALDEGLRISFSDNMLDHPTLKALVVKPTLMGIGPLTQRLFSLALNKGLVISLSSSFETGIGLYQIARLAEFLKLPFHPMGLDTYRFLSKDILLERHTISHGRMFFSNAFPDMKYLAEVEYA